MSALLRSQEKTVAFCPGFNEPLACKEIKESDWPHQICRKEFVNNCELDLKKYKDNSTANIFDYAQTYNIEGDTWRQIIQSPESVEEIHASLEKQFSDVDFFFYRWNQSSFYFHDWVRKGSNYLWMTMIRNPLDRACSSYQKHNWTLHQSLENTCAFAKKVESILDNNQFYLMHYEDLIADGENEIQKLYSFLGCQNKKVKIDGIKGSNGKDFKPQSSRIHERHKKEDGYLSEADSFSGLYKNQTMRYQTDIWASPDGSLYRLFTEKNYNTYKEKLSEFDFYSRYFQDGCEPMKTVDDFLDMPFKETPDFSF